MDNSIKILIVYYSRTKTTKKLAEVIAEKLDADIEEIIDKKERSGPVGYVIAGRDALKKRLTKIKDIKKNPENYDLVLIGTPVWVGTMSSAIRTYCEQNKGIFKKVAFFSTQGSAKRQRVFDDLEKVVGKKPLAKLRLSTKEVRKNVSLKKLEGFIKKLK